MQEVPQRRDEMPGMRNIVPPNCRADVIEEHVSDVFGAVLAAEHGSAEHSRNCISNMLVLGNGVNLVRREVAKADQVFETNHRSLSPDRRGAEPAAHFDPGEDQISLTDPDSRAMAAHTRVAVGYNAQVAVDAKHKLLVEQQVTNPRRIRLARCCASALSPVASSPPYPPSPWTNPWRGKTPRAAANTGSRYKAGSRRATEPRAAGLPSGRERRCGEPDRPGHHPRTGARTRCAQARG